MRSTYSSSSFGTHHILFPPRLQALCREQCRTGSVTFLQRFGSAANLHIHAHVIVIDGVFTEAANGQLSFHPAGPPTAAQLRLTTNAAPAASGTQLADGRTGGEVMNLKTGESSKDLFGGEVPEDIRNLIEAAKQTPRESAASVLWTAQALSPSSLPTYYLLYKLHAGRGELDEAERATRLGLRESALQAGLPSELAEPQELDVPGVDFGSVGPARFWLFTIKALAFISVRKGNVALARQLVDFAARHSTGCEVTAMLVAVSPRCRKIDAAARCASN